MINIIDSYVLKKSIKTLKRWSNIEELKELSLAVNISANKFLEPHFVDELKIYKTQNHLANNKGR